jgi:hypothetical protein
VDIFVDDGNVGKWTTAQLSYPRYNAGAASLPSQGLALFVGGQGAVLRK